MNKINIILKTTRSNGAPALTKILRTDLDKHTAIPLDPFSPKDVINDAVERVARAYQRQLCPSLPLVEQIAGNRVNWRTVVQDIPNDLWNEYGFYEADAVDCNESITLRHAGDYVFVPSQRAHTDFMFRTVSEHMWDLKRQKQRKKPNKNYSARIQTYCVEICCKYPDCTRIEYYINMIMEAKRLPDTFWD